MDNYDSLTKGAKVTLLKLYKNYLDKIDSGADRELAKQFGGSDDIKKNIIKDESISNIDSYCHELSDQKLLDITVADDLVYISSLTNLAINIMENRFARNAAKVLNTIVKIGSVI